MSLPQLPDELRVGTVQWNISRASVGENLESLDRILAELASSGPHLVLLPEMWSRGFCGNALLEEAEALPSRQASMQERAARHRIWIGGTLPEPGDGRRVFNTFYLYDGEGILRFSYRKIHLFPLTREPEFFLPGDSLPAPCEAGSWRIGAGICFDIRFPGLFTSQVAQGANLLLLPAQFPDPRQEHFRLLARARALENQACVVGVNRTGADGALTYFGGSLICNFQGEIIGEMSRDEGGAVRTIRASEGEALRAAFPLQERISSLAAPLRP